MLKIQAFSKTYPGGKRAVDHLSLYVKAGDIYGFIGHNGAGKTTTIRAACGVLPFKEGDIFIDGVSIRKDARTCKQKLAYLPDNPDIYDELSGMEYLQFVCDVFAVTKEERQERIERYARLFGLDENLSQPISSYSHGMKQKLLLISAFSHDPKLIVMDEPFIGLDPKASFAVKQLMKTFCDEGGAIFFSTHVLEVAEKLCNKVAIIHEGKLIAHGPTKKVIGDKTLENYYLELSENA